MLKFSPDMTRPESFTGMIHAPEKRNILAVLNGGKPARHTLFEFFMNDALYQDITRGIIYSQSDPHWRYKRLADTFRLLGYDYVNMHACDITFPKKPSAHGRTISLNSRAMIADRAGFEAYSWPNPAEITLERVDAVAEYIPAGMGITVYGPGGVEENLIDLMGYDNLCYMLADDPDLVRDITDKIGSILLNYYEICAAHPAVDALIANDDWGFNRQTLLSPDDLKEYIIPWHRRIAKAVHGQNKPAIIHSCGNLERVMDDIIDDIGFDAKHSYEDNILPVEQAYERYSGRISILGGIDLDFVIRQPPEKVYERAADMLVRASEKGRYALGTGNSVPDYVPIQNYLALIAAAVFNR